MTVAVDKRVSDLWWLVLLEGIAILILGFLLLTNTAMIVETLIIFLGVYWLIDGLFSLIRIFVADSELHWGWLLARGILGVLAGLMVVQNPLWASILVPTVLIIILGVQGLIIGAIRLVQAFKGDGVWAAVLGVVNILFALILVANPVLNALVALPMLVGIFAFIGGIGLIIQSFRIRSV